MWVQFARSVAGNKQHRNCRECGKPFELLPKDKGRRVFCSGGCKTKDYRYRVAKAAELGAAGRSPKEIAAELETDLATVKTWLKRKAGER